MISSQCTLDLLNHLVRQGAKKSDCKLGETTVNATVKMWLFATVECRSAIKVTKGEAAFLLYKQQCPQQTVEQSRGREPWCL